MASIAEKARAEAEAAEAEELDRDPDQDDHNESDEEQESTVAPHPAEGLEEPTDTMIAELQAAVDEHHDRVHAIMGPFVAAFVPCDTCNGIGIAYPAPAKPERKMKEGTQECSVCGGYGELELPTKREQFGLEQCDNCNGKGWVGRGNLPPTEAARAAVEQFPADAGAQAAQPQQVTPDSTDPRVQQLRSEGFIVLEKPGS